MKHNQKPHLAGIQEFGVAAYVKDLKAGKLDARAQLGRFVGYDSESKGCRIYWSSKHTVSIERNIVFNENDILTVDKTAVISGDTMDEGEKDKVIQSAEKSVEQKDKDISAQEPEKGEIQTQHDVQTSNSVPFPSTSEPPDELNVESHPESESDHYGRGKRPQKPLGAYKDLNEGLTAAVADYEALPDKEDNDRIFDTLPPDFALLGPFNSEPHSLDEALHGPDAKQWQMALDYKIGQLEKLGTWAIEDPPKGHTPIPCTEV